MQEDFLRRFIEEERYLQNKPLKTKEFIDFCLKRGIKTNEEELEFFEEEGLLYPIIRIERPIGEDEWIKFYDSKCEEKCRPASYGLLEGEKEIEKYPVKYYSQYGFDKHFHKYLLNWLEEGNLFDPSTKPFKEWSSFEGKELDYDSEKIVSFYSVFQLHWLILLKESFSINMSLAGNSIIISSSLERLNGFRLSSNFKIDEFADFETKVEEASRSELPISELVFNFKKKKEELLKMYCNFEKILEFLLLIQSVYTPYGHSSTKTITYHDMNWHEIRYNFDPKKELNELGISIREIGALYGLFSKKSMSILGYRFDWIQLWKSIDWNKKDELEGDIRLGIEYLSWALMLKRFLEDYCDRKILDIDEISNISREDILNFNPDKMDQYGVLLRASRNRMYFDHKSEEDNYYNKYKRLFYLANDFGIDYHSRLIIFVEGKTELEVLPLFFEWIGSKPENLGIDIVNIGGISNFFGPKFRVKNSENKYNTIILNNFLNLINYTLNKWQTLPFFVGDDENNIKKLLDEGICFEFKHEAEKRRLPKKWYHIWKKDFELDNFTNDELAKAINEVLDTLIEAKDVEEIRVDKKGINSLDERIKDSKIEIANVLCKNLFDQYDDTKDENLLKRPIFKLIKKLKVMALRNHPPSNTVVELKNKEIISEE
ncbi:TOPRIM nucleotidyl transferase/hydrolase domain-containing protein [Methanobacterium ferruginis]|uniref:TOPRIM nucleotidyl transferase/hydrolase domain-containing protein n=1 Tax=Methanobacterium ferruginis TaxID=710191 RepID=UPI002573EF60|nr:TOPRIM nucleotidyl transferase/hydrolase domain-containing protein [Methanobacterium ferruginis]BDZ67939.1 hypothetical protein GCM10025860_13870 [Methanobacterium ferruginis]